MNTDWLYRLVHGKKPARSRRRRQPGRGPARNWRYRAWVRTLPCAACGSRHQVEAAHTGSDGATRQKASDYSCIPLCTDCHTMAAGAYHRCTTREEFECRHGLDLAELVRLLNHAWFAHSGKVKG